MADADPHEEIVLNLVTDLDLALREAVRVLLAGGFSPLAAQSMLMQHVAHKLGDLGEELAANQRGEGPPL
jgi:ubiquinone/menaquinone biosynthesis C-methylase UbiE